MRRTVILRLAPAALRAGRLAGEAESVTTGECARVTSVDDLMAFMRADDQPAEPRPPHPEPKEPPR